MWAIFKSEYARQTLLNLQALLDEHRLTLALAAIHAFKLPEWDGYWQWHGLAVASSGYCGESFERWCRFSS